MSENLKENLLFCAMLIGLILLIAFVLLPKEVLRVDIAGSWRVIAIAVIIAIPIAWKMLRSDN